MLLLLEFRAFRLFLFVYRNIDSLLLRLDMVKGINLNEQKRNEILRILLRGLTEQIYYLYI